MARIETLTGRLYLDTNIFVYALEGYPVFRPILTSLFAAIDRGDIQAVTSELTLAEVLVKPLLDRSREREAAYLQALRPSTSARSKQAALRALPRWTSTGQMSPTSHYPSKQRSRKRFCGVTSDRAGQPCC